MPSRKMIGSLIVVIAIGSSWCQAGEGVFIPAAARADIVHDLARHTLYISNGTSLLRYDTVAQSFLSPINLGGNLKGMDMSPDGNTLVVADDTQTGDNAWVYAINLDTLTSRQLSFPILRDDQGRAMESGTWSVAFGNDGYIYSTSDFPGSGGPPLRKIDPVSGATTRLMHLYMKTMLSPTDDRRLIAFVQDFTYQNAKNVGIYRVSDGNVTLGQIPEYYNASVDVTASSDGSRFAVVGLWNTDILNSALEPTQSLGSKGETPIGAVFAPNANVLYTTWWDADGAHPLVQAFDSRTGQLLQTVDTSPTPYLHYVYWGYQSGRMAVSQDGALLFTTVPGGVKMYSVPEPVTLWLVLSVGLAVRRRV